MNSPRRVTERLLGLLYAAALRAFPAGFRARFSPPMEDAFRRHCAAAPHTVTAVWRGVHATIEAIDQGMAERWSRRAERRGHRRRPGLAAGGASWAWLLRDLRFALRGFRRSPVFSVTTLAVIALGVGAATAIFSVVNALVFGGLPFEESHRLVEVVETYQPETGPQERRAVSYPAYRDWLRHTTVFAELGIRDFENVAVRVGDDSPVLLGAAFETPSIFRMLGATPAVGRLLIEEDDRLGRRVTVLSHEVWQTWFGGASSVVGRDITVNDVAVTVVGVARAGYGGPFGGVDLWLPFRSEGAFVASRPSSTLERRGRRGFVTIARLAANATMGQAQREIDRISAGLHARGELSPNRGALVVSFEDEYLGEARTTAWILGAAVVLVMLIVCANVANLQLARQLARSRELALRRALGASRGAVARQLLVENVTLAAVGGGLGAVTAVWLTETLTAPGLSSVPVYIKPHIDVADLVFAITLSAVSGVLVGLLPAVSSTKMGLGPSLNAGSRSPTDSASGRRIGVRRALVIGQVAIAFPLLVASGLLIRSVTNTLAVNTGFMADGVGVAQVNLPATRYDGAARTRFAQRLVTRLENHPTITRAAVASDVPLNRGYTAMSVGVNVPAYAGQEFRVYVHRVSPGYFEALGIPLRLGRVFTDHDAAGHPPVVIISQQMASRFWPDGNAVGGRIDDAAVVGVVADATFRSLIPDPEGNPNDPDVFYPYAQGPNAQLQVAVKATASAAETGDLIRAVVRQIDSTLPVYGLSGLRDIVLAQVAPSRAAMHQLGAFAAMALMLAAAGLFGLMAYTVSQQTAEIGLRMALGAGRRRVLGRFLGQGLSLVGAGLLVGAAVALVSSRVLASQLFNVPRNDPATYGMVAAVLAGIAVLACGVPALRAIRVDPIRALRGE